MNKNFISNAFGDEGGRWLVTLTVNGNTITYHGKFFIAGQQYPIRGSFTFAADRTSATGNKDISADGGKTFTPWYEQTYAEANPGS